MIPLRGVVLLPGMKTTVTTGRPARLAAVEEALAGDGTLFVVAQKDIAVELPGPDDVFRAGALARVASRETLDDGRVRVVLEGVRRAATDAIEDDGRCWRARLRFEPRSGRRPDRVAAAVERLLPVLRSFVRDRSQGSSPKQRAHWQPFLEIGDAETLAERLGGELFPNAIYWDLDVGPRQKFLEAFALDARLDLVRERLAERVAQVREERARGRRLLVDVSLNEPAARAWHRVDDLTIWKHRIRNVEHASLPPCTSRPNPLALDDVVVASVFSPGIVYAVDRATGERRWSVKVGELGRSSLYAAEGLLYGGTSATLLAIDPATGEVRWRYCPYGTRSEYVYSSPVVHRGRLFLGDRAGRLHCLDARTGKLRWWAETSTVKNRDMNATGLVVGGLFVTATNAGFAAAFAVETGERVWKRRLDHGSITELERYRGSVFVRTGSSLYLLDPKDGSVRARHTRRGRRIKAHCVAGGTLLAVSERVRPPRGEFQSMKDQVDVSGTAVLSGVRDGRVVFERPAARYVSALRWVGSTRLVYESRLDGLAILDPRSGERIHGFLPQRALADAGHPDARDGVLYVLSGDGVLRALRHPVAASRSAP